MCPNFDYFSRNQDTKTRWYGKFEKKIRRWSTAYLRGRYEVKFFVSCKSVPSWRSLNKEQKFYAKTTPATAVKFVFI